MDSFENLYQRAMQHKREARNAMMKLAMDLDYCTSITDFEDVIEKWGGWTYTGNWINFYVNGVSVELHVEAMVLLAHTQDADIAHARYMLDYNNHSRLHKVAQKMAARVEE